MIEIQNLKFRYAESEFLLSIDKLSIESGEKIAILGPSGCGKTTLLNLISGIEKPSAGSVNVLGTPISTLSDAHRRNFRIQHVGMVFQEFELIEYLKAIENILLPFDINQSFAKRNNAKSRAKQLAESAGISSKLKRRPAQLSRGEQQRVAICRALIANPKIILADEPTGNLDPKNKQVILDLLFEQCNQHGLTLIAVTHDHSLLNRFDRTVDFEQLRFSVDEGASS